MGPREWNTIEVDRMKFIVYVICNFLFVYCLWLPVCVCLYGTGPVFGNRKSQFSYNNTHY